MGRPGWAFSKDGDFSNEKWQKVDSGKPGVNLMVSDFVFNFESL